MKIDFTNSQPNNYPPSISEGGNKTPEQVNQENHENPTFEEVEILEKVKEIEKDFHFLLTQPPTQQNKIKAIKLNLALFVQIERMEKQNKNKLVQLIEVNNTAKDENNLGTLQVLNEIACKIFNG